MLKAGLPVYQLFPVSVACCAGLLSCQSAWLQCLSSGNVAWHRSWGGPALLSVSQLGLHTHLA